MKPTIKVSWVAPDGENQAIFDNWDELIHWLCVNKGTKLEVEIFEQHCMTCYMADLCEVSEVIL